MTIKLLRDLKRVLDSKGKLSESEEDLIITSIGKPGVDFLKGAMVSSPVIWHVFRAAPVVSRMTLSTVGGVAAGRWYGGRSMDAGIDMLLGLHGTRIQTELASLILREYKDDKSLLKLVRKHFYSEQVYGDVNPDVPLFRWRPRNSYVDSSSSQNHTQASQNHTQADRAELHQNSHQYKTTTKNNEATSDSSESNELPEKQNTGVNRDWNLFVDPLESIFGYTEDRKETKPMRQSEESEVLSRRHTRARKRAHRSQRSNGAGDS